MERWLVWIGCKLICFLCGSSCKERERERERWKYALFIQAKITQVQQPHSGKNVWMTLIIMWWRSAITYYFDSFIEGQSAAEFMYECWLLEWNKTVTRKSQCERNFALSTFLCLSCEGKESKNRMAKCMKCTSPSGWCVMGSDKWIRCDTYFWWWFAFLPFQFSIRPFELGHLSQSQIISNQPPHTQPSTWSPEKLSP